MESVDDRTSIASGTSASRARSLLLEVAQTVLLTLVIFFGVKVLTQTFRVDGASMEPTLHTGQYLLINKVVYFHPEGTFLEALLPGEGAGNGSPRYLFGGPRRGDIIVFQAPGSPGKDYIKRVIALPGEKVAVRKGRVYINDQPLDEPYIVYTAGYDLPPRTVPEGMYFVLGDNRPNSSDSHLGWFVPAENIVGRAWISYWPPSLWGVVGGDTAYAR